jgi:hypothetical protein
MLVHPKTTGRLKPNAGAHLLPEAGATQERTLEAVRCSALFGDAFTLHVFLWYVVDGTWE